MAGKFQKGDRVSFVGDPVAGTTAKGTVMQFVEKAGQYEIHTDLGSVIHLAEEKLEKSRGGKKNEEE